MNTSATLAETLIPATVDRDQLFVEAGREATDSSLENGLVRPEGTEKLLPLPPNCEIKLPLS